jgi:hypothetical protein
MEDIWEGKKRKKKKEKGKNRYKQERMSNQPHDGTNREWERKKKERGLQGFILSVLMPGASRTLKLLVN